jgi:hypothetical protein
MALALSPWLWWVSRLDWLPWEAPWFAWRRGFSWGGTFRGLGWLVLAVSPFLLAGVIWAVAGSARDAARSWWRRRSGGLQADDPFDQKDGRVFLLALAAPAALWAMAAGVVGRGTPGLAALPLFAGLMLLVARWIETPLPPAAHRLAQSATLLIAGAYSIVALDSDIVRHLGLRWPYAIDPTSDRRGWRETADAVAAAHRAIGAAEPAAPAIVIAEPDGLASMLNFYLPRRGSGLACHAVDRLAVESDFALWPGYAGPGGLAAGGGAVFVIEAGTGANPARLERQFERVEPLRTIEIRRGGEVVRTLVLFTCRGYRGPG